MDMQKFIEEVKAMTVLELNELVKALEAEFGVSAAPPVAAAGAAAAAAGAAATAALTPNSASNALTSSFNSRTVIAFTSSISFCTSMVFNPPIFLMIF